MIAAIFSRSAVASLLAAMWALSLSLPATAQIKYAFEDEEDKGPWQEAQVEFPAPPAEAALLPLQTEANATLRFSVDPKSVVVGPDGVVRYTVASISPGGARSVSYEGIRCKTFERRVYGYNHKDSWNKSRTSEWKRIVRGERNGYADTLALDFFCAGTAQTGTADEIVQRIREKRVLNPRIQY